MRNIFTETFTGEKQLYPGMKFRVIQNMIYLFKKPVLPFEVHDDLKDPFKPRYIFGTEEFLVYSSPSHQGLNYALMGKNETGIILSCNKFPLNFS